MKFEDWILAFIVIVILVPAVTKLLLTTYFHEKEKYVDRLVRKQKGASDGKPD